MYENLFFRTFRDAPINFETCKLLRKLRTAKQYNKDLENEYLELLAKVAAADASEMLYVTQESIWKIFMLGILFIIANIHFRIDDKEQQLAFEAHLKFTKLIGSSNSPVVDTTKYHLLLDKIGHTHKAMKDMYANYRKDPK